jgi:hypothetical protein
MKRPLPWYMPLLALYPVLFLYAHNQDLVIFRDVLTPGGLALGATVVLWVVLRVILRDGARAAMLATALVFLFQSFGLLETYVAMPLLCWSLLVVLAALLVLRLRSVPPALVTGLNLVAVVLVALPLASMSLSWARHYRAAGAASTSGGRALQASPSSSSQGLRPNIYHLVLDGYARPDVLERIYSFDDRPFIRALERDGFFIPQRSRANYWQTVYSLASTFNASYLSLVDGLVNVVELEDGEKGIVEDLVRNSRVRRFLKTHGYRTVAFATGYPGTEMKDADVYRDVYLRGIARLSPFGYAALSLTPTLAILRALHPQTASEYDGHRALILNVFDHIADVSDQEAPLWVFAHIVAPHPPFVFRADGSSFAPPRAFTMADGSDFKKRGGTEEEYLSGYREQVQFVNREVLRAVRQILDRSTRPTVIILESDHGPGSRLNWDEREKTDFSERLSNFIALRLAHGEIPRLPQDLTPVNLYRYLFDRYFGLRLGPLPNHSYYVIDSFPCRLVEVPPQAE